jgi:hypothetical protein
MNKETRLLDCLDRMFGTRNKIKSQFRKVGQVFDERTGEHVFYIEYRVRGEFDTKSTPHSRAKKLNLIRQINARVR